MGNEEDGGPMPRLDNSIDIKAPIETVFEYLADIPSHPEWVKWTKQAEITSVDKKGLGVTTSELMQVGPRKERVESIVTEFKDAEFFTRRHTRGMEMTDRLSVVKTHDGTKVAWSIDYVPPMGPLGKMMDTLFMVRLFDQLMKDSLVLLQERLESAR
jgi:uncharacterized membrane protein